MSDVRGYLAEGQSVKTCDCIYAWIVAMCGVGFGGLMLSGGCALVGERDDLRAEAVRRGQAEWITGKDNTPEFKWKAVK